MASMYRRPWLATFEKAAILAFLAALFLSVILAWLLPKSYVSTVVLRLEFLPALVSKRTVGVAEADVAWPIRSECKVIQSRAILQEVINGLNPGQPSGKAVSETSVEALIGLSRCLDVDYKPGIDAIIIRVERKDANEAVRIANAIAATYTNYCGRSRSSNGLSPVTRVEIVERAEPFRQEVRPAKLRTIGLGALIGLAASLLAGGVSVWISALKANKHPALPNILAFVAGLLVPFFILFLFAFYIPGMTYGVATFAGLLLALPIAASIGRICFRVGENQAWTLRVFQIAFLVTFICEFCLCFLVFFVLPRSFSGAAELRWGLKAPNGESAESLGNQSFNPSVLQTELEILRSGLLLGRVIADLDLNKEWGKRFGAGGALKTHESVNILRGKLEVVPFAGTSIMKIRCYWDDPKQASTFANAIAETYRSYCVDSWSTNGNLAVECLSKAQPSFKPVRPEALMHHLSALWTALLMGLLAGTGAGWLAYLIRKKSAIWPTILAPLVILAFLLLAGLFISIGSETLSWGMLGLLPIYAIGAAVAWATHVLDRRYPAWPTTFFPIAMAVLLLALVVSALSAMLPIEVFSATARIKLGAEPSAKIPAQSVYAPAFLQAQCEIVKSELILNQLPDVTAVGKSGTLRSDGGSSRSDKKIDGIRQRLQVRALERTSILEVKGRGTDPSETVWLVNEVAEAYVRNCDASDPGGAISKKFRAQIIDRAVPIVTPEIPNRPLIMLLGMLTGLVLAFVAGGLITFLGYRGSRERNAAPGDCGTPQVGKINPPM